MCEYWLATHGGRIPGPTETLPNGFKIGSYFRWLKQDNNIEIKKRLEKKFLISLTNRKYDNRKDKYQLCE